MSRRTAEASKAIRLAWEQERNRVLAGKGTRDWNPQQQKDIVEKGRAYDTDGKAFEGQHMKSADRYPEYQGDPDNIQFLTRKEHLKAHHGDWHNPTNWSYDPRFNLYFDFGNRKPLPPVALNLSTPIYNPNKEQPLQPEPPKSGWTRFKDNVKLILKATGQYIVENPKEFGECVRSIEHLTGMDKTDLDYSYSNNEHYESYYSISDDDDEDDDEIDSEIVEPEYEKTQNDNENESLPGSPKSSHDRKGYTAHRWKKDENGELVLQETQVRATRIHPELESDNKPKKGKK